MIAETCVGPPEAVADSDGDVTFERVCRDERDRLRRLAHRMLRDRAEADDVVQDAYWRLASVGLAAIDDPSAWLTVVVRRLCLTRMDSAYRRRESVSAEVTSEDSMSEFSGAGVDPAELVALDDRVRGALGVVLDRMTPAERTPFLLHDVFGFRFGEIAGVLGCSEESCRQLASRGRRAVRAGTARPVPTPTSAQHRRVVDRFAAACATGDVTGLVEVMAPGSG